MQICMTQNIGSPGVPVRFSPAGYYDQKTVRLDGFPYDITLEGRVRWNDLEKYDGYLFPGRPPPENMKYEQCNRIKIAINKKEDKLRELYT